LAYFYGVNKQKTMDTKKSAIPYLLAVVAITTVIFSICSTTSPLYTFCDESHCFFNVGKAILNGQVLYKDILEQKGLIIYLIQIPAYLISHTTFIGVWAIQIILLILFSISAYRLNICLGLDDFQSLIAIAISDLIIFTSQSLASGQIVEVYALPFFMYSLYSLTRNLEESRDFSWQMILLNGIFAGIILWMKYSLLGFYFAWAAFVCIYLLIKKGFCKAFITGLVFLGGMLIVTIPCLLYFFLNGAIKDLFDCYFINNISGYGNQITLGGLVYNYIHTLYSELRWNLPVMAFLIIGVCTVLLSRMKVATKLSLIIIALLNAIVVFSHGPMFPYYLFAFAPFVVFGGHGIAKVIGLLLKKQTLRKLTAVLVSLVVCVLAYVYKPCPREFLADTAALSQYVFAEYMNSKHESPTMLNYDFLDGGFYTVADIVPNTWAYCGLNWDNPLMDHDQLETIRNRKVDFVVTNRNDNLPKELFENYALVYQISQYRVDTMFTYYLYEAR